LKSPDHASGRGFAFSGDRLDLAPAQNSSAKSLPAFRARYVGKAGSRASRSRREAAAAMGRRWFFTVRCARSIDRDRDGSDAT
jgi:hypothetical protein